MTDRDEFLRQQHEAEEADADRFREQESLRNPAYDGEMGIFEDFGGDETAQGEEEVEMEWDEEWWEDEDGEPDVEPDGDDSLPQWADYYSNESDYLAAEYPEMLNPGMHDLDW